MANLLLRECQVVLKTYLPELKVDIENVGNKVHVKNKPRFVEALRAASLVPSLSKLAGTILAMPPFPGEGALIEQNESQNIHGNLANLVTQSSALLNFLNASLPPPPEWYFSIRLPDQAVQVDGLSKAVNRAFVAFDHPIRRLYGSPLVVSTVEPGSLIVEIAAHSEDILKAVGMIVTFGTAFAGYKLVKLKIEGAKLENRGKELDNEGKAIDLETKKVEQETKETELETKKVELETKKIELEANTVGIEAKKSEQDARQREREEGRFKRQYDGTLADMEEAIDGLLGPDRLGDKETASCIEQAVQEYAEMYAENARVRLQLNASAEVEAKFPDEALPLKALLTPATLRDPPLLGPRKKG